MRNLPIRRVSSRRASTPGEHPESPYPLDVGQVGRQALVGPEPIEGSQLDVLGRSQRTDQVLLQGQSTGRVQVGAANLHTGHSMEPRLLPQVVANAGEPVALS